MFDISPKTTAAFALNKQAVLAAMHAERVRLKASQVVVACRYSGSKGTGCVTKLELHAFSRGVSLAPQFQFPRVQCQKVLIRSAAHDRLWDEENPVAQELDFDRACEVLMDQALSLTGHRGYEATDVGAEGVLSLGVDEAHPPMVRLLHEDQMMVGEDPVVDL